MIPCDSNIFFQLFRGNQVIYEELEEIGFENLGISDVTIAEIYFGMKKNKQNYLFENSIDITLPKIAQSYLLK